MVYYLLHQDHQIQLNRLGHLRVYQHNQSPGHIALQSREDNNEVGCKQGDFPHIETDAEP